MGSYTRSQIYVIFLHSRKIIMFSKITLPSLEVGNIRSVCFWLPKRSGHPLMLGHNRSVLFAEHSAAQEGLLVFSALFPQPHLGSQGSRVVSSCEGTCHSLALHYRRLR